MRGIGRNYIRMVSQLKAKIRNSSQKCEKFLEIYEILSSIKCKIYMIFPNKIFAQLYCIENMGKRVNLTAPKTYDEKLWWLKLNYKDPLMTICSDKYEVRKYVAQCGLKELLIPLIGVYNAFEEIHFDKLQDEVILKCNHVSGGNVIYNPKKNFNYKKEKLKFDRLMRKNYYFVSREWNYKNIKPRILIEKVLRDRKGNLPKDYKFLCFEGIPKLMYLIENTCTETGRHESPDKRFLNVYDMEWNLTNISQGFPIKCNKMIKKPVTFEKMKEYASVLAKPFPECRVDFYEIEGKVYFGELTFYDGGGCNNTQPEEWDLKLGSWIDIGKAKDHINQNYKR